MLAGRRKSGKTAFAECIVELPMRFKPVSFADALRADFSEVSKVPIADLLDVDKKEKHRLDMINHAEKVRAKDRYYFADLLFSYLDEEDNWVIDDLRTIEELELGLKAGATPYRVYADNSVRKTRGWVYNPSVDNDYLETEMDLSSETFRSLGGDWIWNNTNDRDDLRFKAFTLLTTI
jgi:phosphomevalonate kinase